MEMVRRASERLVAERFILQEDAEAFIKHAEERDLGMPVERIPRATFAIWARNKLWEISP
jgi:hypothetical protein